MVKLNRIYTRTGDAGHTGLGDGARVWKHDVRVAAYGDVDEANATIGLAASVCDQSESEQAAIRETLLEIQQDLFDVGADLCVPREDNEKDESKLRVTSAQVDRLERIIDEQNARLSPLNSFVLPGGSTLAAHLHLARTVTRRAERSVVMLLEEQSDATNELTAVYLNRLGDLLFVLARVANGLGGSDVLWVPGKNRGGSAG